MRLLEGAPYTPAAKMGPDYLRERFREIREQQEKEKQEAERERRLVAVPTVTRKGNV